MITYERRVKVTGFHTLSAHGIGAEIQFSFKINIEGEWYQESITDYFENIGDAPHIGEVITIKVQVFTDSHDNTTWTLEMIGW